MSPAEQDQSAKANFRSINTQLEFMLKENIKKTLHTMDSENDRSQSKLFASIENLKIFYESLEAKEKYLWLENENQRKQII